MRSALPGYNHNVRIGSSVYHVQTEHQASRRAVVTDVFADGGRVIASRRTSYTDLDDAEAVRTLMKAQHKQMMVELRGG